MDGLSGSFMNQILKSTPRWKQFWALTKPRVTQLAVFCAVIGMFLATPGLPDWRLLIAATVGIWLLAGAAFAINCLVEREIDSRMARTANGASAESSNAREELGRAAAMSGDRVLANRTDHFRVIENPGDLVRRETVRHVVILEDLAQ